MKTRTKVLTGIIAILLSCVLLFTIVVVGNNTNKSGTVVAKTRTVELSELSVDAQSVLNEFDNAALTRDGGITRFSGSKKVNKKDCYDIDYINDENAEQEEVDLYFDIAYNEDSANVSLNVLLEDGEEVNILDNIQGLALDGENGEVEIWYIIEDEIVSQSEILSIDCESLDEVGLFDWLKKVVKTVSNAVKTVQRVIVSCFIDSVTIAAAVAELALNYGSINSVTATVQRVESNYSHNLKQTFNVAVSGNQKGFINSQGQLKFQDWRYGNGFNLKEKGCGVIATYNVLYNYSKISNTSTNLGNTAELANIVKNYEYAFGTVLMGVAGTNPLHIAPYLRSCGLSVGVYPNALISSFLSKCNTMSKSQIAIMCYVYEHNNIPLMHYICIKKTAGNNLFLINEPNSTIYSNIQEFLSTKNKFFYGWII